MEPTHFLNIDLDLRAKSGLKELITAFGSSITDLERECTDTASVELSWQPQTVDDAIEGFYNIVVALSPEARALWDNCETRCMDIGIRSGTTPHQKSFQLSRKSISLLNALNADVSISVYAP